MRNYLLQVSVIAGYQIQQIPEKGHMVQQLKWFDYNNQNEGTN